MRFQLPQLPYQPEALAPYISAETLRFHYGQHHRNYVEKMNQLLEAPTAWQDELTLEEVVQTSSGPLFNNAAQAWNHTFFWHCLAAPGASEGASGGPGTQGGVGGCVGGEPQGELLRAIIDSFGSFEHFRQLFSEKAAGVFGSGWAWLVKDRMDRLSVVTTGNADTPIVGDEVPLLTLDVWEHAYYIDYRNNRTKFIDAFWKVVNWDFVAANLNLDTAPNMTRLMLSTPRVSPESQPLPPQQPQPQPQL